MHILLWTEDARELARFMGYFLSKLAREVGRLTGWKEKIFGRRYQAIVVSTFTSHLRPSWRAGQFFRARLGLTNCAKRNIPSRNIGAHHNARC
jgi:hypothetical protein